MKDIQDETNDVLGWGREIVNQNLIHEGEGLRKEREGDKHELKGVLLVRQGKWNIADVL